ncbi:MAG: amidase [Rhodospirillales bacterium]|nr:amidase [Rhodospirillales bacterium]
MVEAVEWYLARIERFRRLNAVREISPRALQQAKLADDALAAGRELDPLHGIPVLLKDNILASEMKACAGARALGQFAPRRDAGIVARLRAAGCIVLGKTNMTEFADYVSDVMPSEFSSAGGVVENPHGIRYDRGQGSSVGSAAAVAASLAPLAIGSETQNSIQAPACWSSVVGYKPSVGRVSRAGVVPLVPSQDSPGPLARCVADAALVGARLAGADPRDSWTLTYAQCAAPDADKAVDLAGLRIGVPRRQVAARAEFDGVMPLFDAVLSRLASGGATIVDPCDLPSAEQLQEVRSSVFRTEFKAALNAFLEDCNGPGGMHCLADIIAWNDRHPDAIPYGQPLLIAAQETNGLADALYRADRARDVALSLDAGIAATLSMHDVDVLVAPMGAGAKCTGKAGAPVLAVPAGKHASGAPFGITLFCKPGGDATLLAIGAAIERTLGGRDLPAMQSAPRSDRGS